MTGRFPSGSKQRYEAIIGPALTCGSECCAMKVSAQHRGETCLLRHLRSITGTTPPIGGAYYRTDIILVVVRMAAPLAAR